MKEYIHRFESVSDYNSYINSSDYTEPFVSATKIMGGGGVDSTPSYRVNYNVNLKEIPLTFEITSAGNIVWKAYNTAYTVTLEYSKDNGQNWTQITSNTGTSAPSISVSAGDTVQFRCGTDDGYATMVISGDIYKRNIFSGTTCGFKLKGNIMSLLNKDSFSTADTLQSAYTFCLLFEDCRGLTDTSKLVLPATTLAENCYSNMFYGCTSLTTAPELPATTLASSCYQYMFRDCRGLTTAPALPATTLANRCYESMFYGCTSLTTAPELPVTTLADYCYQSMFRSCTGLTTAPTLPATTLAQNCYSNMFYQCRNLTTAPALPATTLAYGCYQGMFYNCSNLNYIKAMFTTTPSTTYTNNWVSGVASTGTFVKNSAASWDVSGVNGVPTGWTVQTATS